MLNQQQVSLSQNSKVRPVLAYVRLHTADKVMHVAGDGNCGHRAFAIGLTVAIASLPQSARNAFQKHLARLAEDIRADAQLLKYRSLSGGNAHDGLHHLQVTLFWTYVA